MSAKYQIILPEYLENAIAQLRGLKHSRGRTTSLKYVEDFGRVGILSRKNASINADWIGYDWVNHPGGCGANGWHIKREDTLIPADLDGDGREEIVIVSSRTGSGGKYIGVLKKENQTLVTLSGSIARNWINHPGQTGSNGWCMRNGDKYLVGDFDGDGTDEIVIVSPKPSGGKRYIGLLRFVNGKLVCVSGSIRKEWVRFPGSNQDNGWYLRKKDRFYVADIDGDGKDEIVVVSPRPAGGNQYIGVLYVSNGKIYAKRRNIIKNWVNHPGGSGANGWHLGNGDKFYVAKFTTGRKQDLVVVSKRGRGSSKYIGILSDSNGRLTAVSGSIKSNWINHPGQTGSNGWHMKDGDSIYVGDFNGDQKDELIFVSKKTSGGNKYIGYIKRTGDKLYAINGSILNNTVRPTGSSQPDPWQLRDSDRYHPAKLKYYDRDILVTINPGRKTMGEIYVHNNKPRTGWSRQYRVLYPEFGSQAGWLMGKYDTLKIARFGDNGRDEIVVMNKYSYSGERMRKFSLDTNPKYLLLVGDVDRTPGYSLKRTWRDSGKKKSYNYISDAYLGMRANDIVPRFAIGRLSSNDFYELRRICSRLFSYPMNTSRSWRKRVILSGFVPRLNRTEDDSGWECKDAIGDFFDIKMEYENDDSKSRAQRSLWGALDSTKQSFIDTINNGALILQYFGHGSPRSWGNIGSSSANESFTNDDLHSSITLTDKLPLVISATCNTGRIAHEPALSELWQRELKAIGIFAADHESSSWWNERITPRIYYQIVTLRRRIVGEIMLRAMKKLKDDYGSSLGEFEKHTIKMYRYLGDPDTELEIP